MASLKKTNSNKKKTFRKNVSKKSLRKSALNKKVSGGAFPPGIMRRMIENQYMKRCYQQLKDRGKNPETMLVEDLFTLCSGTFLDDDHEEGKKSISKIELAGQFNFWTLEGWLNYLNSGGTYKGKRHAMGKGRIRNVVLSNGTTLGDDKNRSVQIAVIGTDDDTAYQKELAQIFHMTAGTIAEKIAEKERKQAKDVTLGEAMNYEVGHRMKKAVEDEESASDTPSEADLFGKNEMPFDNSATFVKEISNPSAKYTITQQDAKNIIEGTVKLGGGKSKRKTYKKTNKKKKK